APSCMTAFGAKTVCSALGDSLTTARKNAAITARACAGSAGVSSTTSPLEVSPRRSAFGSVGSRSMSAPAGWGAGFGRVVTVSNAGPCVAHPSASAPTPNRRADLERLEHGIIGAGERNQRARFDAVKARRQRGRFRDDQREVSAVEARDARLAHRVLAEQPFDVVAAA